MEVENYGYELYIWVVVTSEMCGIKKLHLNLSSIGHLIKAINLTLSQPKEYSHVRKIHTPSRP